jgi:hypothetical protein
VARIHAAILGFLLPTTTRQIAFWGGKPVRPLSRNSARPSALMALAVITIRSGGNNIDLYVNIPGVFGKF